MLVNMNQALCKNMSKIKVNKTKLLTSKSLKSNEEDKINGY